MKFADLVEYFKKLEGTTKRLQMLDILSELFKKVDKSEIKKTIYLCQEQLLPPFYGVEIGMAEKMVMRGIARATNVSLKKIEELYKEKGDLGLVAESIKPKVAKLIKKKPLTISDVYDTFMRISKTSGEGSVERKIDLFAGMLSNATPLEARYIARFAIGRLRLGIGDPTIMDALSKAVKNNKSLRPTIERAYNLCSDLGLVAETLMKKGIKAIEEFKVKPENPIRMALAERLTSADEIIKKIGKCAIEAKYDGFRAQVHKNGDKVEVFSRNLERLTHMVPEIVDAAKKLKYKSIIFEGEMLAFNESTGEFYPFQVTITRKRKYGIERMREKLPLRLFVFDLLYLNGVDYIDKPYIERRKMIEKIFHDNQEFMPSEMEITDDPKEVERFFEDVVSRGLEGIVAKRLNAPYSAGVRNFNWIKLKRSYKGKLADTIDAVIVGYFKGRGHRAKFGIGAILIAVYNKKKDVFETIAKVGSGFSEEEWVKLREMLDKIKVSKKPARVNSIMKPDVWVEPRYVVTVKADEITKSPSHTCDWDGESGYALRFPRAVNFLRLDKGPEDVNTSKEIKEMFKMQKKVKI